MARTVVRMFVSTGHDWPGTVNGQRFPELLKTETCCLERDPRNENKGRVLRRRRNVGR